jgi:ribonuclease HI
LLELDEIPPFLNTINEITVDTDVVESEFINLFPDAHESLPPLLKKYLHQAVYNLHVVGNMYTTNHLVEPVLRALEAILKIALQENGLPIRKEDAENDSFFIFKERKDVYTLKEHYLSDKLSNDFLKYIVKCYAYFQENRNTLFHWDNPLNDIDTTRVLNTVEEARVIINDSIVLINEYYKIR